MSRLLARWRAFEPVRLYLYSVLVPLILLLIGLGVVTELLGFGILGVAAAALGVPAVEAARSRVTPL